MKWFEKSHITIFESIYMDDLHGYVLPHAGSRHSGHIISHTLRFKPTKRFDYILIMYLPVNKKPNVDEIYYHEYYVPMKSLEVFFPNKTFIGYNILEKSSFENTKLTKDNTLFVISADFSHHLLLHNAIKKENCAAHALSHNLMNLDCTHVVDSIKTFSKFEKYKLKFKMNNTVLQWIGRTRSSNERGVGYLSFLMRDKPSPHIKKPDGFFVTAFDANMNQRECLGNTTSWSPQKERNMIKKVMMLGETNSRLTHGAYRNIPVTNYSVTYLYLKDGKKTHKESEFIRGYHAAMTDALYLPEVFLENVYDNGKWMLSTDRSWPQQFRFNMRESLIKMSIKALENKSEKEKEKIRSMNTTTLSKNLVLFETSVLHKKYNSHNNTRKNNTRKNNTRKNNTRKNNTRRNYRKYTKQNL